MSCENNVCGTGGWNGPQPGDPDNNITLSASTVYGGIKVIWSYPLINGHAVAYTEIYRNDTDDSASAILIEKAGGSSYVDRVNPATDTAYYYWIEVLSIHGTRGARIGPVMAVAKPLSKQTLETLAGRIDEGLLAETLKTSIAGITLNNQAIYKEIQDRLAANQALQNALDAVSSETGEALTYILQETQARTDADGAIVTQVNVIAAGLDDAKAAIAEDRAVRVTKDEAYAIDKLALHTRIDDAEASIIQEREARVTAVSAVVEDYNAIHARVDDAEGAITEIKTLNIDPTSALATKLDTLSTNVENAAAAIENLDTALTTGTHALASSVKTVEATLNGNVATGQVGLISEVNSVTGSLDTMFFAKVQANGLIGGFGIWNNGTEVQAGFDVDTFWVGRTTGVGGDAVKPFIIADGKVFMNEAHIRTASIDSLKLKGEAVTVPVTVTKEHGRKRGTGKYNYMQANIGYVVMDEPGLVYILATASQAFYKNSDVHWDFAIKVNDQGPYRQIEGRQAESAPVISVTVPVPAGKSKIEVLWSGDSQVGLGYCELFMMGVKR